MIGRAIVLVREDQLSLAIGRRGQNVRLASKLCGWDIEIMTAEELEEQIERAVAGFSELEGMTEELAQNLVEQGYLSYDDLEMIEPDALQEMGGLTVDQVELIVNQAEERARQAEQAAAEQRRRHREQEALERARADAAASASTQPQTAADQTVSPAPSAEPPAETPPAAVVEEGGPHEGNGADASASQQEERTLDQEETGDG